MGDPVADFQQKLGGAAQSGRVLVELDQFEQIFGHFNDQVQSVVDWIKGQLAGGCHVLISLRRDYVDDIDQYQADLPDVYRSRVRLLRFTAPQAADFMAKSAAYAEVQFPDDLKAKIAEDLAEGPTAAGATARISPAELQIVCSRLVAGTSDVTLQDYRKRGGRTGLLEEFLLDTIDRFPSGDRQVARHVLFELARRSPTISQRVGLSSLAQTAPQPDRVETILGRLDELGFVNLHRSPADGAVTYELTHEYLIPLIRKFVHETDLEYYKSRTNFDQMQLTYRDGSAPRLGQLLRVSLRLRNNLTGPERKSLGAMWKRSFFWRVVPAGVACIVLMATGSVFLYQIHHWHYLASNSAARVRIEASGRFLVDDTISHEQVPIDVYRGAPWLPMTTEVTWETGYYLDELSAEGSKSLAAVPAVPNEGRDFERVLEPLLSDPVKRTMILVNTDRGAEALQILNKEMEAPLPIKERHLIYEAMASLGTKEAAKVLLDRYLKVEDRRDQRQLLYAMGDLPPSLRDDTLAEALTSDKLLLAERLDFIHSYKPAVCARYSGFLKQLAKSSSVEIRGVANIALARGGMACDFQAIRALRDALKKDPEPFRVLGSNGIRFEKTLLAASALALCTESLENCIEIAPELERALAWWSESRRYPDFDFEGCESITVGLARALNDPGAAQKLFKFVWSKPADPKANSIADVLTKVGGEHVVGDVLAHLKDVSSIPSAVGLLRYASLDQLRQHQAALVKLAESAPPVDARSRLHAGLALVRIEDSVGISTLRDILTDLGRARPAGMNAQRWPYVATGIVREEIFQKPNNYGVLREFLATLGPSLSLLDARAMLGDRSVIPELTDSLNADHFVQQEDLLPLSRIESPELYRALDQMANSQKDDTRNNAVKCLAVLRGPERIKILSKLAVEPRNYFVYYNNRTIGYGAVGGVKMEQYPNESLLALVIITQSDNARARRAAADLATSFLDLVVHADEDTLKAIGELMKSPYEEVRLVAVDLLSRTGRPADVTLFRKALNDPSFHVKKRAARALAKLQKREAFDLLDHASWAVRSGAAEGFGSIADADMIAQLEQYEEKKGGRVSRPVWLIKAQVRNRVDEKQPVLKVQFKELSPP